MKSRVEKKSRMHKTGSIRRFLSLLLILCMMLTYVPTGAFAKENLQDSTEQSQVSGFVSDDNGYIKYFVDIETGGFYILPSDQLFDGTKAASFGSFKIDGEEYTFGGDYPDSEFVLPPVLGDEGTCQSEWRIGNTYITQFLNIIQNDSRNNSHAVYVRYEVNNENASELKGRILLDTLFGLDDDMPVAASANLRYVTNETMIAKNEMPQYYGVDGITDTAPQAYGLLIHESVTIPDSLTFAHFNNVCNTAFDYLPDEKMNFTDAGDSLGADSAALLFFEMEQGDEEEPFHFSTIYGFDNLEFTGKGEGSEENSRENTTEQFSDIATDVTDVMEARTLPDAYPFKVGTAGETNPTIVGFGGIQWSVIGHNGVGVASEEGTITLLANERSGDVFSYSNSSRTYYADSALNARLTGAYHALSTDEQNVVVSRILDGITDYSYYPVEGPVEVSADFWALSKAEADQVNGEVRKLVGGHNWWTRSWDPLTSYSMYIVSGGSGGFPASEWTANVNNARAACILDLSQVAFAMPTGSKGSASDGWTSLNDTSSDPLKLTVLRDSLSLAVHDFAIDWNSNSCTYSFEEATEGVRLSSAIVDESGVVKSYTVLQDSIGTTASSEKVTFALPDELDIADRLLIFAETVTDDATIDFCSEPFEVALRPTLTTEIGDGFILKEAPIYDGSASSTIIIEQDKSTFVGETPTQVIASLALKDSRGITIDFAATNIQDGIEVTFEWPKDNITFELVSLPAKKVTVGAKENIVGTFFDEDIGLDITIDTAAVNIPAVGLAAAGNQISFRLVASEGTIPDSTISVLNAANNQLITDVEGTYQDIEGGRLYIYTFTVPDSDIVLVFDTAEEELADYGIFTNIPDQRGVLSLVVDGAIVDNGRIAPGKTVTVNIRDVDHIHTYFNALSVLNYISGSTLSIQTVTEAEEYMFTMPKHPVLVNLDVRQKPIYTIRVEKNQSASLEISNERSKETSQENVTGYKDETISFLVTNKDITKTIAAIQILNADTEEEIEIISSSDPYADRFKGQFVLPGHDVLVRAVTEDAPAISVEIAEDMPSDTTITTPDTEILLGSKVAFKLSTTDTRYFLYRPIMKVYDSDGGLLYESLLENETIHTADKPVSYTSAALDKVRGVPAKVVLDVQSRTRVFTKDLHSILPNSTNAEIFKTIDVVGLNMHELDEGDVYFGTSPNPTQSAADYITAYSERQLTISVPQSMLPDGADVTYYVSINGVEKSCTVTIDRKLRTAPYSWLAVISDSNNKHSVIFADSEAELMTLKGSNTITMRFNGDLSYNPDWDFYQFSEGPVLINGVATYTAPTSKHLTITESATGVTVVGYGGKMSIPGYTFFDSDENISATLTNGIKYSNTWAKNSESAWVDPNVQNIVFDYNTGGLNAVVPGLGDGLSVTINNAVLLENDAIFGGKLKMQLTNFKWDNKKEGVIETAKTLKMEKNGFEVDIKRLAYDNEGFKGIEGAGSINLSSLEIPALNLKSPSGKLEINTFDSIYAIEAKVDLKIGEVEGRLGLRPLNNGWPMIDEFKAVIGFEPGVPVLPVAPAGYITNAGVGMDGLVDSLNGNFNAIPPIMFHVYGQFDLIKLLKIEDMSLNIGPTEISFSAKPKILGVDLFERFGGGLYIYNNGVKFDVGADLVILKGFEVIKGGGSLVISYLDRNFSFSGALYARIQIPAIHVADVYAPVPWWKIWNWEKVGTIDIGPITLTQIYAGLNDAGASASVSVLGYGVKVEYTWGGSPSVSLLSDSAGNNTAEFTQDIYDENGEFAGIASFGGNLSVVATSGSNGKSNDFSEFSPLSFDVASLDQIRITNKQITIDEAYCDEYNVPAEERDEIIGEIYDDPRSHFVSFPQGIENDGEDYALLVTAPKNDITIKTPSGNPYILKYATEDDLDAAGCNATVFEGENNDPTIMIRLPKEPGVWHVESSVPFGSSVIEVAPLPEVCKAQLGNKTGDKSDLEWEVKNLSANEEYAIEIRMATDDGSDMANLDPGILLDEFTVTATNDGMANGIYTISDEKLGAFESGDYYPVVALLSVKQGLYDQDGEELEVDSVKLPKSSMNTGAIYSYTNLMQPDSVSDVAIVAAGSGALNAEWPQVSDADGYIVSVFDKDGNPIYKQIESGESSSSEPTQVAYDIPAATDADMLDVDLGGLTPGAQYCVEVTAYREANDTASRFYAASTKSNSLLLPVPTYPVINLDLPGAGLILDDADNKVFYTNKSFDFKVSASQDVTFSVQQDGEDVYLSSDFESSAQLRFNEGDGYSSNVSILATNAAGDVSHTSFIVYLDDVAPPLFISTDEEGSVFSNKDGEYVIMGQSEPFATITDNMGNSKQADERGEFSLTGTLAADITDTPHSIRATDYAENTETADILIKRFAIAESQLASISITPFPSVSLYVGESFPIVIQGELIDGESVVIPSNTVSYDVREGAEHISVDEQTGRISATTVGRAVINVSVQTDSGSLPSEELIIWVKEVGDTSPNPSSAKEVVSVMAPDSAIISGSNITANVVNGTTSSTINLSVSPGATWKLYSDQDCMQEIANKTMALAVGANTAYVKVTAEDGSTKVYTLIITRANSFEPEPVIYEVLDHFGTWTGSGTVSARIDADHTKFENLTLGNIEIGTQYYTIAQGSTVITLTEEHLKSYLNGPYTFVAHFSDGYSENIFLTVNKDSGNNPGSPQAGNRIAATGDDFTPLPLVVSAIVAGTILVVIACRHVRLRYGKK